VPPCSFELTTDFKTPCPPRFIDESQSLFEHRAKFQITVLSTLRLPQTEGNEGNGCSFSRNKQQQNEEEKIYLFI